MLYSKSRKLAIFLSLTLCFTIGANLPSLINANPAVHVIITEVLYDAPNDDATEEWIELFNPSSLPISIESWTLSDNVGNFGLSGIIPSGEYFIIARDGTAFQNLYSISADITGSDLALGNSGDWLKLSDASNNEIDMVAWENEVAGWDIFAIDSTIRRISNVDTDSVSDWELSNSLGNPGTGPHIVVPADDISPTVSIDNIVNGSTVFGIVQILVSATDNDLVSSYEIFIDEELKSTTKFFNWNTLTALDGDHSIVARAQDNSGNWGVSLLNVIVDNSNYVQLDISPIKFMTYNIERSGSDPDWINVVKQENPDIIVYIETGNWDDGNNEQLNQHLVEFNDYFSNEPPYVGNTGQNIGFSTSGEAIMSRFPILSTTQLSDVQLDDGSKYDVSHDFMIWEIDVNGETIYVIGSHLKCCGGADNEEKRERAQEGIINYMDRLGDVPIIYAGDLNSFSPFDIGDLAPEGDLASGPLAMMLDPENAEYGQFTSTQHTFIDVFRELNPSKTGYTFGHQDPTLESRIDFIIANQHFIGDLINSTTGDAGPADTGSDHYNVDVFIKFDYIVKSTSISSIQSSSIQSTFSQSSSDKEDATGPGSLTTIITVLSTSILFSFRYRTFKSTKK
ncbi:MAG: hypothetical protein HeimC2_37170 [Candidatus Heimdallarchaeota archaeon LC_2]|nr:MAG: hypothetical protein HeimC2_37170 [Candidatus Heimdallarchaeota archaeon LC_2]